MTRVPLKRIFLVGCPRSGTTLLQHMLAADTRIVSLPETHFVQQLLRCEDHRRQALVQPGVWRRLQQLRRHWQVRLGRVPRHQAERAWAAIPELDCPVEMSTRWLSVREQMQAFVAALDTHCLRGGGSAWLEKTPDHLFYLDHLQRHLPDAKVIHLLRDGEEVVASLHAAAQRYAPWRPFLDVNLAVDRWNQAMQESLRWQGHPQHLLVRYEQLVQAPEQTLSQLRAFVGLCEPLSPPVAMGGDAGLVRVDEPWKQDAAGPLHDRRKFEQMFNPLQQAHIRAELLPLPTPLPDLAAA